MGSIGGNFSIARTTITKSNCKELQSVITSNYWASWNASSHMHQTSAGLGKFGVRYQKDSNFSNVSITMISNLNSKFMQVYESLKSEIIHDPVFEFDDHSRQRVERMIDYNVPGGKMLRGISIVDSYQLLKGEKLTEDEIFLASTLGWCIEWFQAYGLIIDDILDGSITRRGHPCWFKLPEVGMVAANDAVFLRNHINRILKKHFQGKDYYVHLLELFNEAEFLAIYGQMIEVMEKDLSKYCLSLFRRICLYKTSSYTLYVPVGCALLMFGENLDDHVQVKDILIELGIYFQVQNDYLDTFGDPNMFGKSGTDIEECKCSWLIAKALELANNEQKKILKENYGKKDPAKIAKVKELYHTLNLQGAYEDYEKKTREKLMESIEAQPSKAIQAVLKACLEKIRDIYK